MSETIIVRAATDRRVVDPGGRDVPDEPFAVQPGDPWWATALRVEDVIPLTEEEIAAEKLRVQKEQAGQQAQLEKSPPADTQKAGDKQ